MQNSPRKTRTCNLTYSIVVPPAFLPCAAGPRTGGPLLAPLLLAPIATSLPAFGALALMGRVTAFAALWRRVVLALVLWDSSAVSDREMILLAASSSGLFLISGVLSALEFASTTTAASSRAEILNP